MGKGYDIFSHSFLLPLNICDWDYNPQDSIYLQKIILVNTTVLSYVNYSGIMV